MILVGCKLNSAEGAVDMFIILKLFIMIYCLVLWKPVIKLKEFQNSIGCFFLCGIVTRICILMTKEVTCVMLGLFMLMDCNSEALTWCLYLFSWGWISVTLW